MSGTAQLSVVFVTDRHDTIRTALERFRAQTVRDRIEVVIVHPRGERIDLEAVELQGFAGVRVVESPTVPMGAARAAGVRGASSPLVFVAESHAFPAPTCAAALIEAHRESWAAVVPVIENANPSGALSWAGLMLDYGRWSRGPRREIALPPAYNLAYKRDLLLRHDDRLPELLEPGSELSHELRARGARFLLEPAAVIHHLNVDVPRHWLRERYLVGRLVASRRAARWSRARRLAYTAGAVLLPFVFLARVSRARAKPTSPTPGLLYPALGLGAGAWALGELAGYAAGSPNGLHEQIAEYELHKSSYASPPA